MPEVRVVHCSEQFDILVDSYRPALPYVNGAREQNAMGKREGGGVHIVVCSYHVIWLGNVLNTSS